MAIVRIDGTTAEGRGQFHGHHLADSDGLLFLALLLGSWVVTIAIGWAFWRVAGL